MDPKFTHSIIIEFQYGFDSLDPLHRLGDKMAYALDQSDLGYYDGHEVAMDDSHGRYFLHGINAEQMYKEIEPFLFQVDWLQGAEVSLRFGQEDNDKVKKIEFILERNVDL